MKLLVTIPDNSTVTPLPDNVQVPLVFPVTEINTLLEGSIVDGKFVAKVDGLFRFNVSSQAAVVIDYQVRMHHERLNKFYIGASVAPRNGDGNPESRLVASKDITLRLQAGDVVAFYDLQIGSAFATRWAYDDTNRIEISFED